VAHALVVDEVVGDSHGVHAVFFGFLNQVANADGTVEHRILRVDVQVDEGGAWEDRVSVAMEQDAEFIQYSLELARYLKRICKALREFEKTSGRKVVHRNPQRLLPKTGINV
jgi:hypothetical protein